MMQDTAPYLVTMTRRDPAVNMARFYDIILQPTLFGEMSVIRIWGRIGTRGHAKIATYCESDAAAEQALALERQKRRRGYR